MQTKSILASAWLLSLALPQSIFSQSQPLPAATQSIAIDVSSVFRKPWSNHTSSGLFRARYSYGAPSGYLIGVGLNLNGENYTQSLVEISEERFELMRGSRHVSTFSVDGYLQFGWQEALGALKFFHGPGMGFGQTSLSTIELRTVTRYASDCVEFPMVEAECHVDDVIYLYRYDSFIYTFLSLRYQAGLSIPLSKRFSLLAALTARYNAPLDIYLAREGYLDHVFEKSDGNGLDFDPELLLSFCW